MTIMMKLKTLLETSKTKSPGRSQRIRESMRSSFTFCNPVSRCEVSRPPRYFSTGLWVISSVNSSTVPKIDDCGRKDLTLYESLQTFVNKFKIRRREGEF